MYKELDSIPSELNATLLRIYYLTHEYLSDERSTFMYLLASPYLALLKKTEVFPWIPLILWTISLSFHSMHETSVQACAVLIRREICQEFSTSGVFEIDSRRPAQVIINNFPLLLKVIALMRL